MELPTFDIPSEDPLQVSKCLGVDQHGEAYLSFGPLEDFELLDLSSASSASSDQECPGDPENFLDNLWSDKEILEPIAGQSQVGGWERRHKSPSKELSCVYVNEAALPIRNIVPGSAEPPVRVVESDAILSCLVHLVFGRESRMYRYDEKRRSFRPVDDGVPISGYTPQIFHDLTVGLVEYGSQIRRAKAFSERIQRSKESTNSLVALASGVAITIRALEEHMSASLLSLQTVLQLQTLLDPPRLVLELVSYIIFDIDQADEVEHDDILLSKLLEIAQDPEYSAPRLRLVMNEMLAYISRPWLESIEVSTGLKEKHTLGGIPSMTTRSLPPEEYGPKKAIDDMEVGEDPPRTMPVFMSPDLTESFLEAEDSLRLLQAYVPHHPLARPRELSLHESPSFQWQFSWPDIERAKVKAETYESDVLQVIKGLDESSSTIHQTFEDRSGRSVQSSESQQVFHFLWEIDAPLSSPLTGSQSRLATTVTQILTDTLPPSHIPNTPPISLVPTLSFAPMLLTQSRLLSYSTLQMLFLTHSLRSHLSLLRSFVLFANGPFLVHRLHALFESNLQYPSGPVQYDGGTKGSQMGMRVRWPPRSSELRIALMGVLTESYYSSPVMAKCRNEARTDKAELPGGLSFAIRNDMSDEELEKCMHVDGLEALDYLRIQYRPPKPLDVVIADSVLEKYDRVSRLLLRGARVGWVVKELVKQHRGNGRSNSGSGLGQKFKIELYHFVTTVLGHFWDCIEELWVAFEAKLDDIEASIECYVVGQKMEGVHRLRTLHEEVLDRILASCLLRKRQESVMELLEEIWRIVLQFASIVKHGQGNDEGGFRNMYETWRKKVRVFITVCRGLQDQANVSWKKDGFDGGKLGQEKGNGIGRLVLKLEMNGWYMR